MNRESKLERRRKRARAKIKNKSQHLRLSVFRSRHYIYAQVINDELGKTLVSSSEKELEQKNEKETKIARAQKVGQLLAQKALEAKIKTVYFDRGRYKYHGRVKALAEGAREKGLTF